MSEPIRLPPLRGRNPRGFLAALGALDVATRRLPDLRVTLAWTDGIEPVALLAGPRDLGHLVELCLADRERWADSPVLAWGPDGSPAADLKVPPERVGDWFRAALQTGDRCDSDLLAALVAEGPVSGKAESKPTQLHFTAGQQRFLDIARRLRLASTIEALEEALGGPWRFADPAPDLAWEAGAERLHAHRALAPTKEASTPRGVPGADWLACLGLRFLPVIAQDERLRTTGCVGAWKRETFTWPLWTDSLPATVVAPLCGRDLTSLHPDDRTLMGVHRLLRARIRRSDQGGYGSFGAAEDVAIGADG